MAIFKLGTNLKFSKKMTLAEKNIDKLANFYDNVEIFFRMNTACPLNPISHGRKFWNVFKNCRKPQFRF